MIHLEAVFIHSFDQNEWMLLDLLLNNRVIHFYIEKLPDRK